MMKYEETENSSLAMDVLALLKRTMYKQWVAIYLLMGLLIVAFAAILFYLYLHDCANSYTVTGIYALIDSNGNILSQDMTEEQIKSFMEWWETNGNSE